MTIEVDWEEDARRAADRSRRAQAHHDATKELKARHSEEYEELYRAARVALGLPPARESVSSLKRRVAYLEAKLARESSQ